MGLNVANCPKCGRVYARNALGLCPACVKEVELQYESVSKYLRDNRGCTINELSDATEVPIRQIIKFIRDGRVSIMDAPNMSYPCESCGTLIRESHLCDSCRQKLNKDYRNLSEDEKRRETLRQLDNQISFNIKDRLRDRLK